MLALQSLSGGAVAQLGARLDGIEEVVGSNPIGSTNLTIKRVLQNTPGNKYSLGGRCFSSDIKQPLKSRALAPQETPIRCTEIRSCRTNSTSIKPIASYAVA